MSTEVIRQLFADLGERALHASVASGVSAEHHNQVLTGAQSFLHALDGAESRAASPTHVPASRAFTAATTDLGKRVLALSDELPWIPARKDPTGADRALLPINDLFDLGDVIAGLVLVRPHSFYPEHSHPPQELYLTIEGTADWRFGGSTKWHEVAPDSVFYNPPAAMHGQRNGSLANLSLYVLWP